VKERSIDGLIVRAYCLALLGMQLVNLSILSRVELYAMGDPALWKGRTDWGFWTNFYRKTGRAVGGVAANGALGHPPVNNSYCPFLTAKKRSEYPMPSETEHSFNITISSTTS